MAKKNQYISYLSSAAENLAMALLVMYSNTGFTTDLTQADRDKLLAQRAGFGRTVTGGYDGPTVHVTTDADRGPGSLREAVSGDAPRWIVFDGDYTIRSSEGIKVDSNKTIDGRGRKVTLTAHSHYGLLIAGVSNVIVENLILHDFGDIEKTKSNDPYDAIHVGQLGREDQQQGKLTERIWIDHCDLSMAGDKLISVSATTSITVSWNYFHDQEQVFQIGSMSGQKDDANTTITSHHNYFSRTGYRHPVISYGKLHAYNNYVVGWKLYGIRSERVAQAYLEGNIFEAGENKRATLFMPSGKGFNDAHTLQDKRPGYLKSVENLKLNGAKTLTHEPEKVFTPSTFYSYQVEPASPALAKTIATDAGWQPTAFFSLGTSASKSK